MIDAKVGFSVSGYLRFSLFILHLIDIMLFTFIFFHDMKTEKHHIFIYTSESMILINK